METGTLLRVARNRSGLTLRALAARAGTSHSALAAYEAGRVAPTVDTFARILAAAGFTLTPQLTRTVAPDAERARELVDALELAAEFPARHVDAPLPIFPRR